MKGIMPNKRIHWKQEKKTIKLQRKRGETLLFIENEGYTQRIIANAGLIK